MPSFPFDGMQPSSYRFRQIHRQQYRPAFGNSFNAHSLLAFRRILPPRTTYLPSTSVKQTRGRFSSICGNPLIDFTSFANLSSLITLGFFGFGLIIPIGTEIISAISSKLQIMPDIINKHKKQIIKRLQRCTLAIF